MPKPKSFVFSPVLIWELIFLLSYFLQGDAYECDEELFYRPYVKVKRKRNGMELASIRSTGFLDLRYRSGIVLCMNGPVVLYSDAEKIDPDTRLKANSDLSKDSLSSVPDARYPSPDHGITEIDPDDDEVIFKNWELKVFNHDCISANRVPASVLKKMRIDQGRRNPEIMPDTSVTGKLVLGVYLIGDKEGYNRPVLAWFKGRNYEYIKSKDKTVKDGSFMLNFPTTHFCLRLPDGTRATFLHQLRPGGNPHTIIRWSLGEETLTPKHIQMRDYRRVFQRGFDNNGVRNGEPTFQEGDYEIYPCPEADGGDNKIILTMAKTTPEPVTHANYTEFDPFSLFNPNIWTPHGYRKDTMGFSGGDERSEDRGQSTGVAQDIAVPCSFAPTDPLCEDSGDTEATTLKDMQNVDPRNDAGSMTVLMGLNVQLPEYDNASCTESVNSRRLLELVLELVPSFVPSDPIKPGVEPSTVQRQESPKYLNLDSNGTLAWKWDLLYLTSDIFSQLCMPFRPEMPYSVARVFAWYLMKGHLFGGMLGQTKAPKPGEPEKLPGLDSKFDPVAERVDPWPILMNELERCSTAAKNENGGRGLQFQWETGDDESGKWKVPSIDGRETKRRRRRNTADPLPEENIEDIDAETGEKILSRQKRAGNYKINGSVITTKYVLPGKSLTAVMSEGTWGFAREAIQEYRTRPNLNDPRADASKYSGHPHNVQHCWNPQEDPVTKQIVCAKTEDLFYYEEHLEIIHELNIAIELWWKIWATVIGYCNKAYHSRKSETFPRLYSLATEYFFNVVNYEWIAPQDNEDLKVIFSEYMTEESQIWLDSCLEAAYVNSNSQSFRPPRPVACPHLDPAGKNVAANYFEDLPPEIYHRYHPDPSVTMR